jgi:hypothetical protein
MGHREILYSTIYKGRDKIGDIVQKEVEKAKQIRRKRE